MLAGPGGPHVAARVVRAAVEGCITQTNMVHDGDGIYSVSMRQNIRPRWSSRTRLVRAARGGVRVLAGPGGPHVAARVVRAAQGVFHQTLDFYFQQSVHKVVLQKSTPVQIRQPMLYFYKYKEQDHGFMRQLALLFYCNKRAIVLESSSNCVGILPDIDRKRFSLYSLAAGEGLLVHPRDKGLNLI